MAQTKQEKIALVKEGAEKMTASQAVVFTAFSKTPVAELQTLRRTLREEGGEFRIIKKRLVSIMLKEQGYEGFDPRDHEGQLGVIFGSNDVSSIAQPAYQFAKGHDHFSLIGGIDVSAKEVLDTEMINAIGSLPSREELLGQVMGAFTSPVRAFMYMLQERAKQLEAQG
jgi:large subunit ribosomal protein L10